MSMLKRQADRWWSLVLMSLTLPAGLAPFVDAGSFNSPIFNTIRGIAPIEVWGAAWLVASACAMYAVVSGRWIAYVAANSLTLGLSMAWLGAVSWARWIDGQMLTLTAVGLWLFPMAACLHAISTPTEVTAIPKGS